MWPGKKWQPSTEALYRRVGGAYQLCEEFRFIMGHRPGFGGRCGFISFDAAGHVTVAPGYVWDGASGPTIDTLDCICGSLGHDVMYELMRAGLLALYVYKPVADLWLYKRLQADGMFQYRAWAWFRAVEHFGKSGTLPENAPPIERAPVPFPKAEAPKREIIPGYFVTVADA